MYPRRHVDFGGCRGPQWPAGEQADWVSLPGRGL